MSFNKNNFNKLNYFSIDFSERIERLHKRSCILSSFCNLISFDCVPKKHAAEIQRGYTKYAGSYGEIIKPLLSKCRDISKVTAKKIALALKLVS